jgi:DNA-binding transcriptional regulator YdaS (Cro superfamily)
MGWRPAEQPERANARRAHTIRAATRGSGLREAKRPEVAPGV